MLLTPLLAHAYCASAHPSPPTPHPPPHFKIRTRALDDTILSLKDLVQF